MAFVNRTEELQALERIWAAGRSGMALVWGRRRVGKTALLARFAEGKPSVFHTGAGRPAVDELRRLSKAAVGAGGGVRDLEARPFADWDDAFDTLADFAADRRLLLVLDEFPALVESTPALPGILRAFWDRARSRTKLRVVLCGSAVRLMQAMQEERAPLYGRMDLSLLVHPFEPRESALMLKRSTPSTRALVWSLVGGVPLYLGRWEEGRSVRENLLDLACTPGGFLLAEGQLVLATEVDTGDLAERVLRAVASGRTKYNEIKDAVGAEPARTIDRLVELRLLERVAPVTEDPRRTRRTLYRVSDNFLAFWLGLLDRFRTEIERGLGAQIVDPLLASLDDHAGPRWEDAFRSHVRRLARAGEFGPSVVAVGPYWSGPGSNQVEIDAVVLAGRRREAIAAGEAKWSRRVDARRIVTDLHRKVPNLPRVVAAPKLIVAARDRVYHAEGTISLTAADIFAAGP